MRTELARRLEQERSEYDRLMASVEQLYGRARWLPTRPRKSFLWKEHPI